MKKIIKIVLIVCTIIVILDQLTKFLVIKYISSGFGNQNFKVEIVENTGMAFGFNDGNTKNIFLTVIILFIIISFLRNQKNELDTKTTIAVSLALGGGISNLIDRIFRGGVLDFISIWKFPKFNIADVSICIAWFLLIIFLIIYTNKKDVIKEVPKEELIIKDNGNKNRSKNWKTR
ncbi:MAG: signal peptidase II [Clostridia bacterium]|nr:signal peptidase II [Clostridia bacterium]